MLEGCVFCDREKILGDVEVEHGADGSEHYVFAPPNPVTDGHLLVVPKVHVSDAAQEPLVTAMAAGVAARVAVRYPQFNLITSTGTLATQSVFHLHFHIVPRRWGDDLLLPWTPRPDHSVQRGW